MRRLYPGLQNIFLANGLSYRGYRHLHNSPHVCGYMGMGVCEALTHTLTYSHTHILANTPPDMTSRAHTFQTIVDSANNAAITPFQRRVYAALRLIPRGRVTTYASLARRLGCGSPRAVGQALRRNPFSPEVPCHRVIRSDLTIGGFAGNRSGPQVARKVALLQAEGIEFSNGHLQDQSRLIDMPAPATHTH